MANDKVFPNRLKDIIFAFYQPQGKIILDNPDSRFLIKYNQLDKNRIKLIQKVVYYVMCTNATSEMFKVYYSIPNRTLTEACDIYNIQADEKISCDNFRNYVYRDMRNLRKSLDWILTQLLFGNEIGVEEIDILINCRVKEVSLMESNFIIDFGDNTNNNKLGKERFLEIVEILRPYSKEFIRLVSSTITNEELGYLNNLYTYREILDEEDRLRYNTLINM